MHTNQSTSLLTSAWTRKAASMQPRSWLQTVRIWMARARTRRSLVELDDHMLRDIGIDRRDALREANRLPWDGDDAAHWTIIRRLL